MKLTQSEATLAQIDGQLGFPERPVTHEWAGELMTEEEKRLAERVSILQGLLPPFVCAIYNGQARDWDREEVLSMLTNQDNLNGESLPSRLTEDDVSAYINKLFAQHESKTNPKSLA